MNNIRIGIIGVGNMGSAHANCIGNGEIEGMMLTAVCDIDPKRTDKYIESGSGIAVFQNYEELLQSKVIDAVLIAVPHRLHATIAIEALQAGLHVLTEKPVDIRVSQAERLNETAEKSGKVFGIMFNQRTNPLFQRARDIVQSGQLGELKRSVWIVTNWYRTQRYYDSGDWRATWAGEGGGVLLNQAPHNLDLWQWICGMPVSVTGYCDVAKYHDIEVEDDATVLVRYANGATGTFITSTGEYPGTNRLEISGDLGKLVLENGVLKHWRLKQSERGICRTSEKGMPKPEYEYTELVQDGRESAHKGILQNFANAILHGEELLAPGTDGIKELTLSNAAYLSSWKGNREVGIPFDVTEFDRLLDERIRTSVWRDAVIREAKETAEYKDRWRVNW